MGGGRARVAQETESLDAWLHVLSIRPHSQPVLPHSAFLLSRLLTTERLRGMKRKSLQLDCSGDGVLVNWVSLKRWRRGEDFGTSPRQNGVYGEASPLREEEGALHAGFVMPTQVNLGKPSDHVPSFPLLAKWDSIMHSAYLTERLQGKLMKQTTHQMPHTSVAFSW